MGMRCVPADDALRSRVGCLYCVLPRLCLKRGLTLWRTPQKPGKNGVSGEGQTPFQTEPRTTQSFTTGIAMWSIKPGRGPSARNAVSGIVAVVFGIFWTLMAYTITRGSPFPFVGVVFPLFGVVIVVLGIADVIYNFYNAISQNRFSTLDVTRPGDEPDPLQQQFGPPFPPASSASLPHTPVADAFCPSCGQGVQRSFRFCPTCGGPLPV